MALDFGAAHASWADMAEEEEGGFLAPLSTVSTAHCAQAGPSASSLAAELDCSRDGLNLTFKSVRSPSLPPPPAATLGLGLPLLSYVRDGV